MMRAYWDSSALILALQNVKVRDRLAHEGAFTRSHSLAECFSTLTGGRLGFRCDANQVARMLQELSDDLIIVPLDSKEILKALVTAKSRGVRGGLVHDFLHIVAAEKSGIERVFTLNRDDFLSLDSSLQIVDPEC